jgi:hypothetical protein
LIKGNGSLIILILSSKINLNRFSEIAKQAPPPAPRIQQQAHVIIPHTRQELFPNRRPVALTTAQRLKKVFPLQTNLSLDNLNVLAKY